MSDTIKQLIKELKDIEGIDNKLDYYKNEYYLKYSQDGEKLAKVLQCEKFITPLKLPEAVYNAYFNPYRLNEEEKGAYYLWWVDFIAEYDSHYFPKYKRQIDELRRLKDPEKILDKEKEKIKEFEESVDRLYESGYISFENPLLPEKYFEEQIYLKLSQDYYRVHPSRELAHHLKDIADVKAKYILKKDYLKRYKSQKTNSQANILESPINQIYFSIIYGDLKSYFPKEEHSSLQSLLKKGNIESKLHFKGQMKVLGSYFHNYKVKGWLEIDSGRKIAEWIKQNFKYLHNSEYRDFSTGKLQRWITGSEKDKNFIPPSINNT